MAAYDDLMAYQRTTEALSQVAGRLGWDQETIMPRGAAEQRSEEMGAMEEILHARRTDPRIGDWLAAAKPASEDQKAQLRKIRRTYERNTKVPADLAAELARVTSRAQGVWAEARGNEDVAAFLPILGQVVDLRRQEAAALASDGNLYDALLNDYEPGATGVEISELFGRMRPRLVALRDKIMGASNQPDKLVGQFDADGQAKLAETLALTFGYNTDRGRIDRSVHPFSSGSGLDVRITTRVSESDPFNCFYSTIHEVGHATYEQNVDQAFLLTPLGGGVSMGVHESQSRIYENQFGRSEAFTQFLFEKMTAQFGTLSTPDPWAFYRAVNRVSPSHIRTESDEVQYNLHVMMRFDIEQKLISGQLDVADLEEAWNTQFEADFGVAVDKPSNGVLQDVHWSVGLFGYFPTYSLGNVYAGCLFEALKADIPGHEEAVRKGELSAVTDWLRDKVQVHGGLYGPKEVIERATGSAPTEEPLLSYLEAKFTKLYDL